MKLSKIALSVIVLFSLAFLIYEILGYFNFNFAMYDLGLYNRHMWSLVRFDFSANPIRGFNLLGDHSHFILFLFIPIYALFQTPLTLVIIQALAIGISGLPIYLIAKKYLKNEYSSILFLIAYYLYFGFASGLAFPFHLSTLSVLPLAFALYFLLQKNYKLLVIFLVVLLLTKEDLPLVVIMFGLYLIIIQKQYKLGGIIMAVSALYFIFLSKYFLPTISGHKYSYSETSKLGSGFLEITINIIKKPFVFIKEMYQPADKLRIIKYSLFSFAGLSLFGLEIFLLLSPIWLGRFLSNLPSRWLTVFHYSANQGPILAVAAIIGAERIASFLKVYLKKEYLIAGLSVLVLGCSLFVNYKLRSPILKIFTKNFYLDSPEKKTARTAISMIPKDASVAAGSPFVNLSSRKEIYMAPIEFDKLKPDYIMINSLDYYPFGSKEEAIVYAEEALQKYGYQELVNENGIYLLKKGY